MPRTQTAIALKLSWRGVARASSRAASRRASRRATPRASGRQRSRLVEGVPPAIAAQRNASPSRSAAGRGVGLDIVLGAERGEQLVLLRVRVGLLGAHETGVDHALDDLSSDVNRLRRRCGRGRGASRRRAPERALAVEGPARGRRRSNACWRRRAPRPAPSGRRSVREHGGGERRSVERGRISQSEAWSASAARRDASAPPR